MEAIDDFWWADRFGWDPATVDSIDARRAAMLRQTTAAIDEGRRQAEEDAAKSK